LNGLSKVTQGVMNCGDQVRKLLWFQLVVRVFQILLPQAPTPERCLEGYYLHRIRFELIAERKVRRRQLTDDGNIEITGRDLRDREARPAACGSGLGGLGHEGGAASLPGS
jgi:hypothetical protein